MKIPKPISLLALLVTHLTTSAQVQWYQNQDSHTPASYGTIGTAITPFNSSSFLACYLWSSTDELNTWKIFENKF